jgi:hypothetical protein
MFVIGVEPAGKKTGFTFYLHCVIHHTTLTWGKSWKSPGDFTHYT